MTFLELVQKLHYEAKLAGSPPSAVTGQTGRAADLVRWIADAYADIQREKDGKWKWLLSDFTLDTVADTQSYAYGSATDVDAAVAISRFRRWELDPRNPPLIYLVSDGVDTEIEMRLAEWSTFRRLYIRANPDSSYPLYVTTDRAGKLLLGPTPDAVYRVSGQYWKGVQTLEADDDEPEMPADFHLTIVYQALTKYAYDAVANEILQRAATEGARIFNALSEDQGYARFSLSLAGALA